MMNCELTTCSGRGEPNIHRSASKLPPLYRCPQHDALLVDLSDARPYVVCGELCAESMLACGPYTERGLAAALNDRVVSADETRLLRGDYDNATTPGPWFADYTRCAQCGATIVPASREEAVPA